MEFGFEVMAANPKREKDDDVPTTLPMRAGLSPAVRKKPDADQRRVRRLQVVKNGSVEPTPDTLLEAEEIAPPDRLEDDMWNQGAGELRSFVHPLTATKETQMDPTQADLATLASQESAILRALSSETHTATAQRVLAMELEDVRTRARQIRASMVEVSLQDAFIEPTLTPVIAHQRTTAATDWILEEPDQVASSSVTQAMRSEASAWFEKVHPAVRADREEYAEQARGMARRVAGQFGYQGAAAEAVFLETVSHLNRTAYEHDAPELNPQDPSGAAIPVGDGVHPPMGGVGGGDQGLDPGSNQADQPSMVDDPKGINASRRIAIEEGERSICSKCGLDVEYVGTTPDPAKAFLNIDHGTGWWDQGGNFSCPSGGTHDVGTTASRTAVLSRNCENGNHSDCNGGSCTCSCHKVTSKDYSGACADGDHDECQMNHGSGPDDCRCPDASHKVTARFLGPQHGSLLSRAASLFLTAGDVPDAFKKQWKTKGDGDADDADGKGEKDDHDADDKLPEFLRDKSARRQAVDANPYPAHEQAGYGETSLPTDDPAKDREPLDNFVPEATQTGVNPEMPGAGAQGADPDQANDGSTVGSRKIADGGETCATCDAAIERDPEGETNRGWHHNDGATHDHEAKPKGGTEASRRQAAGQFGTAPNGYDYTAAPASDSGRCDSCNAPLDGGAVDGQNGGKLCSQCSHFASQRLAAVTATSGACEKGDHASCDGRVAGVACACKCHDTTASRRTAGIYCKDHSVWVGDGNADTHKGCSKEQRATEKTKEGSLDDSVALASIEAGHPSSEVLRRLHADGLIEGTFQKPRLTSKGLQVLTKPVSSPTASLRVAVNFGTTIDQHFARLASEENGLADSSLEDVTVTNATDVMWPVELTEEQRKAKDAADVLGVPTPGGAAGYPQPTASRHIAGNPFPAGSVQWFQWEDDPTFMPETRGPIGGTPEWGDGSTGIPLHGDLTEEQQAWMDKRSTLTSQQAAFRNLVQSNLASRRP